MNYELSMFLLNMKYVDLGLVPPAHYPNDDDTSLEKCLSVLGPEQARIAKRKFRKLSRKVRSCKSGKRGCYHTIQSAVKCYVLDKLMKNNRLEDNLE